MDNTTRNIGISTLIIAVIGVAAVMYVLRDILIPFVLAAFLTVLFKPLILMLRQRGAPTWAGLIIVLIISAAAIWGLSMIISFGIESIIDKTPEYTQKVRSLIVDIQRFAGRTTGQILGRPTVLKLDKFFTSENVVAILTSSVGSALSIIADGALVLLYIVFMTLGAEYYPAKQGAALRLMQMPELGAVYASINEKVLKYLRIKTIFNLINGIVQFAVLSIFSVDFAPLLGLLAFLFNYLPNIGSFITTVIPGIVALIQFGSLPYAILIVAILVVLHNIIGNVLEPRAMGITLNLSPTVVLFTLVFWGWMWGIVGMILSVPIMAILVTIMEHFQITQPIAILLSHRAPLEPTISTESE